MFYFLNKQLQKKVSRRRVDTTLQTVACMHNIFFLIHMPHVLVFNFCLQEYKIITISSLGFGCCHFMPREKNYYNVRRYEQ